MQNLEPILIFLTIADMGSFTRAADSLGIQKGRASTAVRKLEDELRQAWIEKERELSQLRQDAGADLTASQRKAIDTQERFVTELHQFREELETVAPLWAPDLNDGVVILLAPLWRLFTYHRAWSSELKKHWAKLVKGDYDWAQLAMRLWPERVVPKCARDRSLAIAHGLEDVFWVKDTASEDKWLPRQPPTTPIAQLIAQRHSPATTAAAVAQMTGRSLSVAER